VVHDGLLSKFFFLVCQHRCIVIAEEKSENQSFFLTIAVVFFFFHLFYFLIEFLNNILNLLFSIAKTNLLLRHIEECFNHSIKVVRRLTRHKHWFQYEDEKLYNDQTLVVAQFRNPYEWLKAMEHVPHHSPAHLRTIPDIPIDVLRSKSHAGNDWKIFLTKPWTTARVGLDLDMKGTEMCQGQERFAFKDIVSCAKEPLPESAYNYTIRFSENEPFYEMRNDGSGLPYDNIMEMRSDKILNHLDVKNFKNIADVWVVQYEYLLADGTQHLIDRIQEWTGIEPKCTAKEPQNRPPRKSRMVDAEYAKYVRKHLNWTVEALVGYYPEYQREE
jgi:hypothetical protein